MDKDSIDKMKEGVIIIRYAARADWINTNDLIGESLKEKKIAAARCWTCTRRSDSFYEDSLIKYRQWCGGRRASFDDVMVTSGVSFFHEKVTA